MFDIKELAVIDRKKGYCGKNIIFKTLEKDNTTAIVGIEDLQNKYDEDLKAHDNCHAVAVWENFMRLFRD